MRADLRTIPLCLAAAIALAAVAGPAHAFCALGITSSGSGNSCIGTGALSSDTTGFNSAAFGFNALQKNTSGFLNTAVGNTALQSNTTGAANTAIGGYAMTKTTTGSANTAAGVQALSNNLNGSRNVAVGQAAMASSTAAGDNTALGTAAASALTTGNLNVAVGYSAGGQWTTGSNNIALGSPGAAADTATIRIGTQGTQTRAFLAGVRGTGVAGGAAVLVDANGQLGIATSSRRFKQDIAPMGDASAALMQLRPVSFRYIAPDAAGEHPLHYGLIAEEVAEVMPALVLRDTAGAPETVAYQELPSLLLNEYQKQNRELAETRARLAAMEREMAALRQAMERLSAPSP